MDCHNSTVYSIDMSDTETPAVSVSMEQPQFQQNPAAVSTCAMKRLLTHLDVTKAPRIDSNTSPREASIRTLSVVEPAEVDAEEEPEKNTQTNYMWAQYGKTQTCQMERKVSEEEAPLIMAESHSPLEVNQDDPEVDLRDYRGTEKAHRGVPGFNTILHCGENTGLVTANMFNTPMSGKIEKMFASSVVNSHCEDQDSRESGNLTIHTSPQEHLKSVEPLVLPVSTGKQTELKENRGTAAAPRPPTSHMSPIKATEPALTSSNDWGKWLPLGESTNILGRNDYVSSTRDLPTQPPTFDGQPVARTDKLSNILEQSRPSSQLTRDSGFLKEDKINWMKWLPTNTPSTGGNRDVSAKPSTVNPPSGSAKAPFEIFHDSFLSDPRTQPKVPTKSRWDSPSDPRTRTSAVVTTASESTTIGKPIPVLQSNSRVVTTKSNTVSRPNTELMEDATIFDLLEQNVRAVRTQQPVKPFSAESTTTVFNHYFGKASKIDPPNRR